MKACRTSSDFGSAEVDPGAAIDSETAATADCSRQRGGVVRQAQPDARDHQVAAGKASASKRKRKAMSAETRAAKRNEGKRTRRAQRKQQSQGNEQRHAPSPPPSVLSSAATALASASEQGADDGELAEEDYDELKELNTMLEANGEDAIDEDEFDMFREWADRHKLPIHVESVYDWQGSREAEAFYFERSVDEWAADAEPDAKEARHCYAGAPDLVVR